MKLFLDVLDKCFASIYVYREEQRSKNYAQLRTSPLTRWICSNASVSPFNSKFQNKEGERRHRAAEGKSKKGSDITVAVKTEQESAVSPSAEAGRCIWPLMELEPGPGPRPEPGPVPPAWSGRRNPRNGDVTVVRGKQPNTTHQQPL